MKSKIICLGAPPCTGKTTVIRRVKEMLGAKWVHLDNDWCFSHQMRVLCAEKSGIELNSPEFARTFNLTGQLAYQALARSIASQGFNVLMPGPFEDLTPVIDGKPLYLKMKEDDFKDFDFKVVYLLLHPKKTLSSSEIVGHSAMDKIEKEIQSRLDKRGQDNPDQVRLDADKRHLTYYSERSSKVLKTVENFPEINLVKYGLKQSPEETAQLLADQIYQG